MGLLSVVVGDFHIAGAARGPDETDPPLIVDSDAVLPLTVSYQLFQPVTWRNAKVVDVVRGVEDQQFPVCRSLNLWAELAAVATAPHLLGLFAGEF
ncbi:hypothetical protein BFN03_17570 [Rhodococcus sp. WMMA185]|nr:hypothetical protein BFN03_17570 [Rhodococcus sp. WMMA185]